MSDKAAAGKGDQPQGGSPWTLLLMVLLTLYICKRPNPEAQVQACGKHLHQIGVALEKFRYGSDDGLYPKTLAEAFKNGTVPHCNAGGDDSYVNGYQPSADRRSYLLVCKGEGHKDGGLPSDYPRIAFGPHETPPSGEESAVQSVASPTPAASPSPQSTPVVKTTPAKASPTPRVVTSPTPNP